MHHCPDCCPRQSRILADLVDVRQTCTVAIFPVNVADMQAGHRDASSKPAFLQRCADLCPEGPCIPLQGQQWHLATVRSRVREIIEDRYLQILK